MKYIKVDWPEIQDYMLSPKYSEEDCYYDPLQNCWFVPDNWEPDDLEFGDNIGDLEDALG